MLRIQKVSNLLSSKKLVLAVTVCMYGAAAMGQGDVLLRYKYMPGEKLTYECTQNVTTNMSFDGKTMTTEMKNILITSQKVKSVDAEGVATVVKIIERVKMSANLPQSQKLEYDSTVEKERTGIEKMIADQFTGILGQPIEMKIDARGNVSDMKMPEGMTGPRAAMLGGDNIKHSLGAFSFPQEAVSTGKTWTSTAPMSGVPGMGKATIQQTFKYLGPDKKNTDLQKIQIKSKMEIKQTENMPMRIKLLNQESEGEILFDNKAGRMKSTKTKDKMTFGLEMQGKTVENSVTTTMEIKLVPNGGAK